MTDPGRRPSRFRVLAVAVHARSDLQIRAQCCGDSRSRGFLVLPAVACLYLSVSCPAIGIAATPPHRSYACIRNHSGLRWATASGRRTDGSVTVMDPDQAELFRGTIRPVPGAPAVSLITASTFGQARQIFGVLHLDALVVWGSGRPRTVIVLRSPALKAGTIKDLSCGT
jgi:hypothetical protein